MITVEINDEQVSAALFRLAAHMADMTQPMERIGDLLVESTQDRILRGVTPEGAAFAPRSPVTVERYQKLGLGFRNPLNQSGRLRGGIFPEAGPDYVQIGSNALQAAVMQFGAAKHSLGPRSPWGNIPARPFLGVSDTDRAGIEEIVAEWLERAVQ